MLWNLLILLALATLKGAPLPQVDLERRINETVRPFLEANCFSCHSGDKPTAQLDLRGYSKMAAVIGDYPRWAVVREKLAAEQMPPRQAKQPTAEARQNVIEWIDAVVKAEA